MSRKPVAISINLAPKDPFFQTFLGKTLRWALSVGRYIVIFTELIVIVSFAARFSLDRQVTDLNELIHQREQVINSFGDLEARVRLVQHKISQYQQIEQQMNLSDIFPTLTAITPTGVELNELSIRATGITLSGVARSQESLNLLISNIQLSTSFANVSVDRIEAGDKRNPGFVFRISATTKTAPAPKTKK